MFENISDKSATVDRCAGAFRTNLDAIRSAPVDFLAVFMEDGCPPGIKCPDYGGEEIGDRRLCIRCWKEWLEAPFDVAAFDVIAEKTVRLCGEV